MRVGIDCRKAADYGIGSYIRGLLTGLEQLGGDEEYVLFAPSELFPLLPSSPRFTLVTASLPRYSVRELVELRAAIPRYELDLFHAPHYVVPSSAVPLVVTIHDLIHLKLPTWRRHPLAPAYARWMMGRAVRKSARIVVGSEAVRKDIEARYPAASPKIIVTPFAVDSMFGTSGAASPARLAGVGLRAQGYLLFVGNDKPHKNLDRLVVAYREFRRTHPDIALALVGGTSRFREEPGVVSAGFVPGEDLPHLYRGAIALIQPSLEEGFGMPVLEAMSCETAVVVANRPALVELAGEAGWVVDPRSTESIAAGLARITEDAPLRRTLAAQGAERAKFYSWRRCAEATRQVYRHAAMERRSS